MTVCLLTEVAGSAGPSTRVSRLSSARHSPGATSALTTQHTGNQAGRGEEGEGRGASSNQFH